MEIAGEWAAGSDGVVRPMVLAHIVGDSGTLREVRFLLDTGADRTVLSAALLEQLNLPPDTRPTGFALQGIGGNSAFVCVTTALEFATTAGSTASVSGTFAAFTDPAATDHSILGRDVLNNFDLVMYRQRGLIRLLAPNHRVQIVAG
jgi:gag-polyprotein putative aspartyl protease